MPEIHSRQASSLDKSGFTYTASGPFTKSKGNLKKQGIHNIFIKMKLTKLLFNMTWLLDILKI